MVKIGAQAHTNLSRAIRARLLVSTHRERAIRARLLASIYLNPRGNPRGNPRANHLSQPLAFMARYRLHTPSIPANPHMAR